MNGETQSYTEEEPRPKKREFYYRGAPGQRQLDRQGYGKEGNSLR